MKHAFVGQIAGVGSTSGVRVVVGSWSSSPLGAFADVMVADAQGRRHLLAPSARVADFVAQTYHFDRVAVGQVSVDSHGRGWIVSAPALELEMLLGSRTALGWLLRCVPGPVARSVAFSAVTDPIARVVLPGVRTRGTAGNGRTECYGAADVHAIDAIRGRWQDTDLGDLAQVFPDPGFGFGSTPRRPGITSLTTTVIGPE